MILKSLKERCIKVLTTNYQVTEANSFFYILAQYYLNLNRVEVALSLTKEIDKTQQQEFQKAIIRLQNQEPIQYIIGETEFYGLSFNVNPSVLIPRPETEELVDWIVQEFKGNGKELKILDIGTGSGCIAISLVKNLPKAKIFALDINEEALKIAKANAVLNNVKITCINANILNLKAGGKELQNLKFDLIVSNPPYVRILEKEKMTANVLEYEPHLALFVEDNDPLLFYRKIIRMATKSLIAKGSLYFEINEYFMKDLVALMKNEGFGTIESRQDIFEKDRMIKGIKY